MKKQLKQFLKLTTMFALINGAVVLKTYAQSNQLIIKPELASKGGGGGRDFEVLKISQQVLVEENLLKLKKFFLNHPELSQDFPEVNISQLTQKIDEVTIEVVDDKLYDKNGAESTALNFPSKNTIQYNSLKLKELSTRPEMFFVLNFHEVLGLLGIEESNHLNANLIESYPVSSRLAKYVTKVNGYELVISNHLDSKISENNECKRTMADWLNSYYANSTKERIINSYCEVFQGNVKVLPSCLNIAYNWVRYSSEDFKYKFALLTCSKVQKRLLDVVAPIVDANTYRYERVEKRTFKCLNKEWKKHSYIFDKNERKLITAKICSEKI